MRPADYETIVDLALSEDFDDVGDITSQATIPAGLEATADLVARSDGVIAGLDVAGYVFRRVDATVVFETLVSDGERVAAGDRLARVTGPARSLLAAERTALNLLARMSGVATATASFVEAISGTGAKITDTRKTSPAMRALDKYSVRMGGGVNNRMGLHDAVMIKDNHLATDLDVAGAVEAARAAVGPTVEITVEVENLAQLEEALETDANRILLDNMDLDTLRKAVMRVNGATETEASGGVTLENVRSIAGTGVEFISVGWITHSAPQLDIALDFLA